MSARLFLLAATLILMHAPDATAQRAADPIRYTLGFPAPQTHYVEVRAEVPTGRQPQVELMMAVWTPGSYLVREYARNVEDLHAVDPAGRELAVDKSRKNRWTIATGSAPSVTVSYRVYGREMSVRTNWIDADFALLNGAPTFLTLTGSAGRPHEVTIEPARGWAQSRTSLTALAGAHHYTAPDFDTLVDSPILVGNPAVYEFTVDGKPHYLVNQGEAGVFDGARAARDLETIVRSYRSMWGFLPYDRYLLFNVITEAGGGLEHKNSAVLMTSRWATRTPRAYRGWLELASHEYFHAWNVKRLRPVELGPFDYEAEVPTRSLWAAEGITDYYSGLTLARAGLSTPVDYIESLSRKIEEEQTTPGRLVQSAAMASFDAWIKYYRPDENSINTSSSYYTKGALIAWLLDARIRTATQGARSLDDVMRAAYQAYAGPRGYTPAQLREVAERVAGVSLAPFWEAAVDGAGELDYAEALGTFGLRFRSAPPTGKAWLGIGTRNDAGRLVITQVRRDGPAWAAGLNVDDEILAIDEFRVRADRFDGRLDQYKPGTAVSVLVARRERLELVPVTFAEEPARTWRLEVSPTATVQQGERLMAWLGQERARP